MSRSGSTPLSTGVWDITTALATIGLIIVVALSLIALAPQEITRKVGLNFESYKRTPAPQAASFTIGATEEEVRAVQGQPTAVKGATWYYSASEVHFQNGRVISWTNSPSHPLRVRVIPSAGL